jgi:hypothetical protein
MFRLPSTFFHAVDNRRNSNDRRRLELSLFVNFNYILTGIIPKGIE